MRKFNYIVPHLIQIVWTIKFFPKIEDRQFYIFKVIIITNARTKQKPLQGLIIKSV